MAGDRAEPGSATALTDAETQRLQVFADLVLKWNRTINLISAPTEAAIWQRHILDSAQIFELAPLEAQTWLDFGSGGGFPGVVVAILAAERRPGMRVTLVESDRRKAAFLMQACRSAGVDSTVLAKRIEDVPPMAADVVSARAVAALSSLLPAGSRHLAPGGILLFPKGARAAAEVADARKSWDFDLVETPSRTDPSAVTLSIRNPVHV